MQVLTECHFVAVSYLKSLISTPGMLKRIIIFAYLRFFALLLIVKPVCSRLLSPFVPSACNPIVFPSRLRNISFPLKILKKRIGHSTYFKAYKIAKVQVNGRPFLEKALMMQSLAELVKLSSYRPMAQQFK